MKSFPTCTLRVGATLFHGTQAPARFEPAVPRGPAWFSNRAVAERFVFYNDWSVGQGERRRPRVLAYRTARPAENLIVIRSTDDFTCLFEAAGLEPCGSHAMAEAVLSLGYSGWVIPRNYPDGPDVMLNFPVAYLEFKKAYRIHHPRVRS